MSVLDEQLRALVRSETQELHHLLITAALCEAAPSRPVTLP
jgi:hypothetical protein